MSDREARRLGRFGPVLRSASESVGQATIGATQAAGKAGLIVGQRAVKATAEVSDQAVAALTHRDNWASVENYLSQVVEVLAAHEAEIATLRAQVAELTDRLNAGE
ncbi:MAG: hypothetical protein ACT4QG_05585 [Sporichthyaceae bacterium]